MSLTLEIFAIIIICILVLAIGALKKKAEWFLHILLRSVVGTACIYFLNQILFDLGYGGGININPCTVLTSGILGIPGVAVLYGINFFFSL
ncbi:MAG: pro-sigmaK processing inhibitor BofA family protein [Lachnospiraceae bacterium]|nr:pro-sigmaK processing inhibitor BofA family protein [Lachnospiraceae bacterium]